MADFFNIDGNATLIKGDSVDARFQLSQDAAGLTPFDYTGYSIAFKIGKGFGKPALLTFDFDSGQLVADDPVNGWVRIALAPDDTSALDPGGYVYELELATPGFKETFVQRGFTLSGDLT